MKEAAFTGADELLGVAALVAGWLTLVIMVAIVCVVSAVRRQDGASPRSGSRSGRMVDRARRPRSFVVLTFEGDPVKHEVLVTWREDRGRLANVEVLELSSRLRWGLARSTASAGRRRRA